MRKVEVNVFKFNELDDEVKDWLIGDYCQRIDHLIYEDEMKQILQDVDVEYFSDGSRYWG